MIRAKRRLDAVLERQLRTWAIGTRSGQSDAHRLAIDGDQRNVELRITKRAGHMLTVVGPPNGAVAPPGPYLLFVNRRAADGALVPSTGTQVFI